MIDLAAETDSVVIDSVGEPRNSFARSLHNEAVEASKKRSGADQKPAPPFIYDTD
jgi:hypothetical protein